MTRARDLAAGTFEQATGGVLKLETSDTTVTDGSVLGKIEFKAPDEASGTDAILVGAAIEAVAEGTFAADNNATELVFKTGASAAADAKMTLTSGGDLLLSGGVFLGGTGAANKLDDYEEGTWTPVFEGETSSGSYSYTEQQGQYVKVGNQVTAWFNLTNIATSSTGSGTLVINGLPFAANWESGFNGEGLGNAQFQGFTDIDGDTINLRISDGATKITCSKLTGTNNVGSVISPSHKVANDSDVRGFVIYYTGG